MLIHFASRRLLGKWIRTKIIQRQELNKTTNHAKKGASFPLPSTSDSLKKTQSPAQINIL
jgi:hypothetical protein